MKRRIVLFDINRTVIHYPDIARSYHKITRQAFNKDEFQKLQERLTREGTFNKNDYDYSEWTSPIIVSRQIEEGEPIIKNVQRLQDFQNDGFELRWFSGRNMDEDFISNALTKKLGLNDITGHAIYKRDDGPEGSHIKKERALREYAAEYDEVIFIDDEDVVLEMAKEIPGIRVMDAKTGEFIGS